MSACDTNSAAFKSTSSHYNDEDGGEMIVI